MPQRALFVSKQSAMMIGTTLLGQLRETQILFREAAGAGAPLDDHNVRIVILDGLLRSNLEVIEANLAAALPRERRWTAEADGACRNYRSHTEELCSWR
jgi:hypothetical protein